ncbi:MAG: hypothetical protein IT204_24200 [Fimbriimonadaceae bacterium]|nr:hypothetical protein [Fimbriimonadaceae bacterium]
MTPRIRTARWVVLLLLALWIAAPGAFTASPARPHAPAALALSPDGQRLYVAEETGQRLVICDAAGRETAAVALPGPATGLAIGPDGRRAYVTCAERKLAVVDLLKPALSATWVVGYGACSPVVDAPGQRLWVCNRWTNSVSALDLATGKPLLGLPAQREPVAAAITPDGATLAVANLLSTAAATATEVAASVTLIDARAKKVAAQVALPDGSHSLNAVALDPAGSTLFVSHLLSRYHLPTTQLERGWMNTNALTLIDLPGRQRIATVLLDDVDRGAANPWGVAASPDGKWLVVAHAGTHEASLIDLPALRQKIDAAKQARESVASRETGGEGYGPAAGISEDLTFMLNIRRRLALPLLGPRAVVATNQAAWVAGYFSDNLVQVALPGGATTAVELLPRVELTQAQRGQLLFADASLCFQNWQSCLSCHPDHRVDGLNWDLLNDGLGNPKNTKNMCLAHATPPSMSLGVRDDATVAVRAGIRYIQFAVRPPEDAEAIDAWLSSLRPRLSPKLVNGQLNTAAQRGKKVFDDPQVGCAKCHRGPLLTDLQSYDVGTGEGLDADLKFDTPTLREVWRSGPFLHDGRAATLKEVVTTANAANRHGQTSKLSAAQINDLVEYLASL